MRVVLLHRDLAEAEEIGHALGCGSRVNTASPKARAEPSKVSAGSSAVRVTAAPPPTVLLGVCVVRWRC